MYVAAVVRRQEQDCCRDLVRGTRTAQWYVDDGAFHKLIDLLLSHTETGIVAWCWDNAWTNRIHPYLALLQIYGPGTRKRTDRRFRRAVDTERRVSGNRDDR